MADPTLLINAGKPDKIRVGKPDKKAATEDFQIGRKF